MNVSPLTTDIVSTGSRSQDTPEKVKSAASQFEALMIGEILKASHSEEEGGFMGTGDADNSGTSAMDFATQFFSQAIASSGGLGLGKMISASLAHQQASNSSPSTQPQPGLPPDTPSSDF